MTDLLQILVSGVAVGSIYGLVALGFVLVYKATETINFAQGDLLMLGAFVAFTFIVGQHVPFWLGLVLTIAVLMAFGYGLDALVLRRAIGRPQFAVVMLTIGLGAIFRSVASAVWGAETRQLPTPFGTGATTIGGVVVADVNIAIIGGTAVLCLVLYLFFSRTRLGIAMQGASQNQLAAYYMGIPVKRVFSQVWAISAGVSAFAGVLLAPVALIDTNMGSVAIKSFSAAVIGGFGSIPGCVLGGVMIGVIEQLSGIYLGTGVKDVAAQVILLLVLVVWPRGLVRQGAGKRV
ncbi:MAG: branched-chain amino acid ABC transporter permease [Rhodospirillaceae bacterium]|nr:branched-chain amino acid ABC transporter permease [Rhodospirillaceae bacterium]